MPGLRSQVGPVSDLVQALSIQEIEEGVRADIYREILHYAQSFAMTGPGGLDYVSANSVLRIVLGDYS